MKTNEELLKMSTDELRTYCSSLKYFTVDKYDYHVVMVQDISVISIECFLIHDNIRLTYHLKNDFSDNIYQSQLFDIERTPEEYSGIFENKEDAIYATKQYVKQQKLNEIEGLKHTIKMIEEEINEL
jgi:hypothetical protein